MRGHLGRGAGSGPPATSPCWALLPSRYQLHSQEEAKERRHSHTIGGLPESDDQTDLPSPPALPMALVGKGPLTSIGQCPLAPSHLSPGSPPRHLGSLLGSGCLWVDGFLLATPRIWCLWPQQGAGMWLGDHGHASPLLQGIQPTTGSLPAVLLSSGGAQRAK